MIRPGSNARPDRAHQGDRFGRLIAQRLRRFHDAEPMLGGDRAAQFGHDVVDEARAFVAQRAVGQP